MTFHDVSKEEALNRLSSDVKCGLDTGKISELQAKYGPNKLREKKKKTGLQRFLEQFKDVMILILIAAAIISFAVICIVLQERS